MCISIKPASFSNTVVYSAEVKKGDDIYHVIGYQNSASPIVINNLMKQNIQINWANTSSPNAMLLPFPADGSVSRNNLVNGSEFKNILKEYDRAVEALRPRTRRLSKSFGPDSIIGAKLNMDIDVFESGSYTVALVQSAVHLKEALKEVPENKRPDIPDSFIDKLTEIYPEWPIALCCFDGAVTKPEPLFWYYKPKDSDTLFAPAIDAHDGNPPDLDAMVFRDHTLVFSSYLSNKKEDISLKEYINKHVPEEHRWMFNAKICGTKLNTNTKNGDFNYPLSLAASSSINSWITEKDIAEFIK